MTHISLGNDDNWAAMLPLQYSSGLQKLTVDIFSTGEIEMYDREKNIIRFRLSNKRNYLVNGAIVPLFVRDNSGRFMPFAKATVDILSDQSESPKHHVRVDFHVIRQIKHSDLFKEIDYIQKLRPFLPSYSYDNLDEMNGFVDTVCNWQENITVRVDYHKDCTITYSFPYDHFKHTDGNYDHVLLLREYAVNNIIHGSGLNYKWYVDIQSGRSGWVQGVFRTAYETMSDLGYYDGAFDLKFRIYRTAMTGWIITGVVPEHSPDESFADFTWEESNDICEGIDEDINHTWKQLLNKEQ